MSTEYRLYKPIGQNYTPLHEDHKSEVGEKEHPPYYDVPERARGKSRLPAQTVQNLAHSFEGTCCA